MKSMNENEKMFAVENILDRRQCQNDLGCEYLVKYSGFGNKNNLWVHENGLQCNDLVDSFNAAFDNPTSSPSITNPSSDHHNATEIEIFIAARKAYCERIPRMDTEVRQTLHPIKSTSPHIQ